MTTPLTASYRLDIPIIVRAMTHHQHIYLGAVASGSVMGYNAVDRLGAGSLDLVDAIETYLGLIIPAYNSTDVTFGTITLEHLVGTNWNPVATHTTALIGTSSAATVLATQFTTTFRDTAFHKVRNILLETDVAVPQKTNSPSGYGSPWTAFADGFTQASVIGNKLPWLWVRGRSDLYIGSFVSMVTDTNDRVRRARGLA